MTEESEEGGRKTGEWEGGGDRRVGGGQREDRKVGGQGGETILKSGGRKRGRQFLARTESVTLPFANRTHSVR